MLQRIYFVLAIAAGLACGPAWARQDAWDVESMARSLGVSELRAGVVLHDVELYSGVPMVIDPTSLDFSKWQNLHLDVLFNLPDHEYLRWVGSPRLALGGSLDFAGKESYARLAAVWHFPMHGTPAFFETMLGASVHNGYLTNAPAGQRNLGCYLLLFYGASLGYEVTEKLSAMVTFEHSSHNGVCHSGPKPDNDGINRLGLRLGWKLD